MQNLKITKLKELKHIRLPRLKNMILEKSPRLLSLLCGGAC